MKWFKSRSIKCLVQRSDLIMSVYTHLRETREADIKRLETRCKILMNYIDRLTGTKNLYISKWESLLLSIEDFLLDHKKLEDRIIYLTMENEKLKGDLEAYIQGSSIDIALNEKSEFKLKQSMIVALHNLPK